ncbi:hypothetical protein A2U01_0041858 [Trifolium medium]|uniref:Uncharacterized protein n=1 Tax=Trifolium medium TaxID=97028 RepID=A0A392QBR2_9FABA|nr:hypothetical protein [Trifolium medium]
MPQWRNSVWSSREEERRHCDGRRGTVVAVVRGGGEAAMSDGRKKMKSCFCILGAWFVEKKIEM